MTIDSKPEGLVQTVTSVKTMRGWTSSWPPFGHAYRTQSYAYEHFDRRNQLRQLLVASGGRWLLTAAVAACLMGMMWSYSSHDVLPASKKRELDVLMIISSVCFSVAVGSALVAMIRQMRWWLLSLHPTSPREADMILRCHNIGELTVLGFVTRRWTVRVFVVVWLLLHATAQLPIASLGLSFNTGTAMDTLITTPGLVSAPDMSDLKSLNKLNPERSPSVHALRHKANIYGLAGIVTGAFSMSKMLQPGTMMMLSPINDVVYCDHVSDNATSHPDLVSCSYVFMEMPPPSGDALIVSTNRHVSVSSKCEGWPAVKGGNGREALVTVLDGASGQELQFPVAALYGPGQTMYMWDPKTQQADWWATIGVLEASDTAAYYYRCNVSFHPVVNALLPEHHLGSNLMRLAASAIALQGYISDESQDHEAALVMLQHHSYPAESCLGEPLKGATARMNLRLSVFAASVIAVTARHNPRVEVQGQLPQMGVRLNVDDWPRIFLIFGVTIASHAVLAIVTAVIASRVQVRGRSNLAMASLLAPALPTAGLDKTCVASGRELAASMEPARLVYVHHEKGGYRIQVR